MQNDDGFLLSSFKLLLLLCAALFLLVVEMAIVYATLSTLIGLQVTDFQALCIAILLQVCIEAVSLVISHCRRKREQLPRED